MSENEAKDEAKAVEKIHEDAKGQYAKPMKHSDNNGVASENRG